jgi:hypothetical protein|tara:strand:- start:5252 stop:5740 length:489 start_codon:yes stop_codon:yes gene_type:complete
MPSYSKAESYRRRKKGFIFESRVCRTILRVFNKWLGKADAKPTPMSNNGEDIILSKKAIKLLPISLECKDHKNRYGGTYDIYEQAEGNAKGNEPVGVITDSFNKRPVLAIVSLDHYLNLNKEIATLKEDKKDKFINGTIKEEGYFVPISIRQNEIVATVTIQ